MELVLRTVESKFQSLLTGRAVTQYVFRSRPFSSANISKQELLKAFYGCAAKLLNGGKVTRSTSPTISAAELETAIGGVVTVEEKPKN